MSPDAIGTKYFDKKSPSPVASRLSPAISWRLGSDMPRIARIIAPNLPHHVTQRGNRREAIFFEKGDQEVYLALLARQTRRMRVEVWAYCLMPNHVHLILVPSDEIGLARAIGETHRRYTNFINARRGCTGHLFQARFSSVVMDEGHLIAGLRYVSLNPVRAGLVRRAQDWPWSSVRAHLRGRDDALVKVAPVLERVGDFAQLLPSDASDSKNFAALRRSETTGRPLGTRDFVLNLERRLDGPIAIRQPGRKRRDSIPISLPAKTGEVSEK